MAAILLALALLIAAGEYAIYKKGFCVDREKCADARRPMKGEQYEPYSEATMALIDEALRREYDPVEIEAFDGIKLFGKFYSAGDGAPVQIMMHGYKSAAERDFCGGLKLALENGCSVLLADQRGHGRSGGRCLTMGVNERRDCVSWAEYFAKRNPGCQILLTGLSMGAATVLMAAGLRLPENVKGIIADCGYTSPEAIIKDVLRRRGLPAGPLYFFARQSLRLFAGIDLSSCSATQALREAKIPILFIHGEDDRFVPCEMGRENYEACTAPKTLITVPGAGHGLSYMVDEERYRRAILTFMKDVLRPEENRTGDLLTEKDEQ